MLLKKINNIVINIFELIMYNLFNIYKQLILLSRNNANIYLNNDLNRYIFSFIIEDYKKIINETFIKKRFRKIYNKSRFFRKTINYIL